MSLVTRHSSLDNMHIPRIYQPIISSQTIHTLDQAASQHVTRVLRLREGATVILFNGNGAVFSATLLAPEGKLAKVRLDKQLEENNESPLQVHIGMAMIKGDRMTYALQKAVELGVSEITPLATEHTVIQLDANRRDSKHEHWQGIIQNAAEQSHRTRLPILHPAMSLAQWTQQVQAAWKCYFDVYATTTLGSVTSTPASVALLTGPEGGLSRGECELAAQYGFTGIRLGMRILRAETAVAAAISAVQLCWGDFR